MYRLVVILALGTLLAACDSTPEPTVIEGNTMGTTYSIKVVDERADEAALRAAIASELEAVNQVMSTWIEDSEISRFNRAEPGTWFPVSVSMIDVVRLSKSIHEASGGKFDITVGPLVNLWGFGPEPPRMEAPPEAEIEATMDRVGMAHIGVRPDALMRRADVSIDLSAIAKGYGVDRIADTLEAAGVTDYLVEIGGELRASGTNERGTPWRIAIERPDVGARVPYTTVDIRDAAIATSGDYRNYFEVDGERYSHLIDPTTGHPIDHNLASVTVVAPTCAEADGLATAISVMGPEAGLAMARQKELAVFVIIKGSEGFETRSSPAFQAYLKQG